MHVFWRAGYSTSIDDLVCALGVTRHSLYGDFGGKDGLFAACLERYRVAIVTPAFSPVEQPGATLATVSRYFETQIELAENIGLPGPGCLIANTMTEVAPHDRAVARIVKNHNDQLQAGFENALANQAKLSKQRIGARTRRELALTLVAFSNGLWSLSRAVDSAAPLRAAYRQMLALIEGRVFA